MWRGKFTKSRDCPIPSSSKIPKSKQLLANSSADLSKKRNHSSLSSSTNGGPSTSSASSAPPAKKVTLNVENSTSSSRSQPAGKNSNPLLTPAQKKQGVGSSGAFTINNVALSSTQKKTTGEVEHHDSANNASILNILNAEGTRNVSNENSLYIGKPHDHYCWHCHADDVQYLCKSCPRSFHSECITTELMVIDKVIVKNNNEVNENMYYFRCPACAPMQNSNDASASEPSVDYGRPESWAFLTEPQLTTLLSRVCSELKAMKVAMPFLDQRKGDPLVYNMSLKILIQKVEHGHYSSVVEFMNDAKWIDHHASVHNKNMLFASRRLLGACVRKIREIGRCPECAYRAIENPQTWFVEPCRYPHLLLWAKLKHYFLWPAKLYGIDSNKKFAFVRYFGKHQSAKISLSDCWHYTEHIHVEPNRLRKKFAAAIKELNEHAEKLDQKFQILSIAAEEIRQLDEENSGPEEIARRFPTLPDIPTLKTSLSCITGPVLLVKDEPQSDECAAPPLEPERPCTENENAVEVRVVAMHETRESCELTNRMQIDESVEGPETSSEIISYSVRSGEIVMDLSVSPSAENQAETPTASAAAGIASAEPSNSGSFATLHAVPRNRNAQLLATMEKTEHFQKLVERMVKVKVKRAIKEKEAQWALKEAKYEVNNTKEKYLRFVAEETLSKLLKACEVRKVREPYSLAYKEVLEFKARQLDQTCEHHKMKCEASNCQQKVAIPCACNLSFYCSMQCMIWDFPRHKEIGCRLLLKYFRTKDPEFSSPAPSGPAASNGANADRPQCPKRSPNCSN